MKIFDRFKKPKSLRDQAEREIRRRLGHRAAEAAVSSLRECIELSSESSARTIPPGGSKLGGLPHLPPAIDWPVYQGTALSFVAQVNFSELQGKIEESPLPPSGIIYLFIHKQREPDGLPDAEGQYRVLYTDEDAASLQPRSLPSGEAEFLLQEESHLDVIPGFSIAAATDLVFEELELGDHESDTLIDLACGGFDAIVGEGGAYRMLGNADDNVVLDWAEKYEGRAGKDSDASHSPSATGIENLGQLKQDFVLLFHLLADELGYPDCFAAYGIHRDDLARRRFDNSVLSFDGN